MFKLIEHTADMGLEARAPTRAALAEEMARGLALMMFAESMASETIRKEVLLYADDPVELLVSWLNEVVYWCDQENLVPARFTITRLDEKELHAIITGENFDSERHVVERQVKSVTYHQARFEKTSDGWYARVFVDL